ncbi:MAG: hypothetical protein M0P71_09390 [Melioribacteraceae bacterium]|nr:hypothetical protein [Melioribacteraceae bacterium]
MGDKEAPKKIKRSFIRKAFNVLLVSMVVFVFIILLLFGFSQTSTFKNYLKDFVVDLADENLNGNLTIGSIDGTLLTSFTINNITLTTQKDTLIAANKIEVVVSPLQLLLKRIYIRSLGLSNVKINLLQNQDSTWNYENIIKPDPDTTKSKSTFDFTIIANNIRLEKIDIVKQTFDNRGSRKRYQTLNMDDLIINDFSLDANAVLDLGNNDYVFTLNNLAFTPNLNRFSLNKFSGVFNANESFLSVKNFRLVTDSSDITINARLDSVNIFGDTELNDFKSYPVRVSLEAKPFNFSDLSSYINSTEILRGAPDILFSANGKFGDIRIDRLLVEYLDTKIDLNGRAQNLNTPENLYFNANIVNSSVYYKDVNELLPTLEIPKFAQLYLEDINISFDGEPQKFSSTISAKLDNGEIKLNAKMNLKTKLMEYDITGETTNLNLMPVIGLNTDLNSSISIKGKGTSPQNLNTSGDITLISTMIDSTMIDDLELKFTAANKKIDLTAEGNSNKSNIYLSSQIIFDNENVPSYSAIGNIYNLDLSKFLNDKKYSSNLNFFFSAEGESFDLDSLNTRISLGVENSTYKDFEIDFSSIDITANTDDSFREIKLESDFIDFRVFGDFSTNQAIELVSYEASAISKVIQEKLASLNPLQVLKTKKTIEEEILEIPYAASNPIHINYEFKFKDFDLIARLIGNDRIDVEGSGEGTIDNKDNNFVITTDMKIDYFLMKSGESIIYLSDSDLNLNFVRDNRYLSFDKLLGTTSISGKRLFFGSTINNFNVDIAFNQSKLFFMTALDYDSLITASTSGAVVMSDKEQEIRINDLSIIMQGLEWKNQDTLSVKFTPESLKFDKFTIGTGKTAINLKGSIDNNKFNNLVIEADSIESYIISNYLFGANDPQFNLTGEFTALLSGTFNDPTFKSTLKLNDFSYEKNRFGSLLGYLNYKDKLFKADIKFLDTTYNVNQPLLTLNASLPFDLTVGEGKTRFIESQPLNIALNTDNFNLAALGQLVPFVNHQSGYVKSDFKITGTYSDPIFDGGLDIEDAFFTVDYTNLDYNVNTKLRFDGNKLLIESLNLMNTRMVTYPGKMGVKGEVEFDGFNLSNIKLNVNGEISVLGKASKSTSPDLYGDLLIAAGDEWEFTYKNNRSFFKGDIILKKTDLTYTTTENSYDSAIKDYDFRIIEDSTRQDNEKKRFDELIAELNKNRNITKKESASSFDYQLNLSIEDEANIVFVLSQVANQKLIVVLSGDLKFEDVKEIQQVQGAFELKDGSKLEFFKTFDATGTVRFESSIANPYLDIVATYIDEYIDPREESGTPQEVAVKIKINGELQEIGASFAKNPGSIGVYIGAKNIQSDNRDTRYDNADAFAFILTGKFKDDLTASDKASVAGQTNALGSTATSFLGPILTNFVNGAVGDLVSNISVSQSGEYTKFALSGKYQKLKYSFGGTTEVFQNFSKANIKFEYLFNPRFLIRVERKDPVVNNYNYEDKINELGLKYRFEF